MISELFIKQYFKSLAESSKDIAHREDRKSFHVLRNLLLDEFDAALKNMVNKIALILEIGEGTFGSDDNVQDNPEISLYFVIRTDGAWDNIDAARDQAKVIAAKFLARMRYDLEDKHTRNDGVDGILRQHKIKFNTSGGYRNLGNIGEDEKWTGKMLDLKLTGIGETNFAYNSNDWN
jgi:hypothetical protein